VHSHTYTDHVSILKFIERNWNLAPLTQRSLDRLPNPVSRNNDPYVPTNRPAIGDLFDLFDFNHHGGSADRGLMRKRPVARRAGNKLAHVSNLKR